MEAIHGDTDFPAEAAGLEAALGNAAQVGIFTLGAQGQDTRGLFAETMGGQADAKRLLESQVSGMRALSRVYGAVGIPALLVRIELGWKGFDAFWVGKGAGISMPVPDAGHPRESAELSPALLWSVLNLWEDTQKDIRPVLAAQLDWEKWDIRMDALRKLLLNQLSSAKGPEKVKVTGISN